MLCEVITKQDVNMCWLLRFWFFLEIHYIMQPKFYLGNLCRGEETVILGMKKLIFERTRKTMSLIFNIKRCKWANGLRNLLDITWKQKVLIRPFQKIAWHMETMLTSINIFWTRTNRMPSSYSFKIWKFENNQIVYFFSTVPARIIYIEIEPPLRKNTQKRPLPWRGIGCH